MAHVNKKKGGSTSPKIRSRRRFFFIFIIPIFMFISLLIYLAEEDLNYRYFSEIPEQYIPIYKAAEKEFGVPWYLLAAHHRVETIFSTMDPMISPVGAEGHMQFMPCTFVGWAHPTCEGLGKGNIPEEEKTDPKVIAKYGGYGIDANGNGKADPWDIEDAIFSAANFLAKSGASEGNLREAIYAYNHSDTYVEEVLYYVNKYKNDEQKTGVSSPVLD